MNGAGTDRTGINRNGLRIALTGGIGSGKSTVAAAFAALGAVLFDADATARALTAPGGAALPALAATFGADILDGSGALDRARMRQLAFADAGARSRLEAVLHPMIAQEARIVEAQAQGRPVVFDIPLLGADSHWRQKAHRVVVVDCPESTQIQRVVMRSGWHPADVKRVIDSQLGRAERRALADAVIHNDGLTMAELEDCVARVWRHWQVAVEQ